MDSRREAAGRLIAEIRAQVRVWLAALGPPERWSEWRAGVRRQFRLSLLTTALLGICLVLVLTPRRARFEEPAPSQLEVGTALVMGSVQNRQDQAVVGVEIAAVSASGGAPIAEGLTQSDGRYILVVPKSLPEKLTVEIRRDHYRKAAIELTPSDLRSLRDGRPVVLPPTVLLRSLGPAFWISTLIFLAVLGLMATGKQHNTLAALIGVASLFAVSYLGSAVREDLFVFDFRGALLYVDWNVIFLIMGMMIVIAVVEETGVFQWLAFKSYELSGGRRWLLLAILMVVAGITSALLDNVTTMLLMAPITVQIALALGMNPLALLMPEVLASNVFGISTLIGTPTNILIGSYARISFSGFLWNLTPGVVLALGGLIVYGEWQYRKELASGDGASADLLQRLSERGRILQPEELRKAGWVGAAMLALFLLGDRIHLLPSVTALVGATALLAWIKPDMEKMMEAIDWTTLVFFIAIFIVVGAVQEVGVISYIADGIGWLVGDSLVLAMLAVIWMGAILSTVIANIPFTAAMLPVVGHLSATVPGAESKVLFLLSGGRQCDGRKWILDWRLRQHGHGWNRRTSGFPDHLCVLPQEGRSRRSRDGQPRHPVAAAAFLCAGLEPKGGFDDCGAHPADRLRGARRTGEPGNRQARHRGGSGIRREADLLPCDGCGVSGLRHAWHAKSGLPQLREMGKFVMLILCDRARARGVAQVDYLLREGNVRTQLRKLAVETGAEVMVIGRPTKSSTKNLFKAAEFDAFVTDLEEDGHLLVIRVEPAPIAEKDLQGGLVL